MRNFRQTHTSKVRNYFARREQRRLLTLVMALGLAIFMMNEARKPDNWLWITSISRADVEPAEPKENAIGRYFTGVKPEYLDTVRDDTIFRHDEQDAWFHLLQILEKTDQQTLEKASIGRVSFAQLFSQSNDYRGRLVTLYGNVRRAHRLTAPKNDYGIKRYYQIWFQPEDNPTTPMVVYCLHLPKGFPTGMDVSAETAITGFFFKRWVYKAQDSLQTAPVVLARTVDWRKPTSQTKETVQVDTWFLLVVFGTAAAISIVVSAYIYTRTRRLRLSNKEQTKCQLWR